MILRRLPMLAVTVAAAGAFVAVAGDTPAPEAAAFATIPAPWMPSVPSGVALTSTWFCPGVPADGAEGSGGAFVLANAGPAPMHGTRDAARRAGPGHRAGGDRRSVLAATIDPSASVVAPFVGAMVEIDGGGGLVEQRATQAAGTSVAPCTTQPSSEWYLAEGFTADELHRAARADQPLRPVGDRRHRLRHRRRIAACRSRAIPSRRARSR